MEALLLTDDGASPAVPRRPICAVRFAPTAEPIGAVSPDTNGGVGVAHG